MKTAGHDGSMHGISDIPWRRVASMSKGNSRDTDTKRVAWNVGSSRRVNRSAPLLRIGAHQERVINIDGVQKYVFLAPLKIVASAVGAGDLVTFRAIFAFSCFYAAPGAQTLASPRSCMNTRGEMERNQPHLW